MKILNWNIWCNNPDQFVNLNKLISDHDPDIVCLQEVSKSNLRKIESNLNLDLIYAADFIDYDKKEKEYFLVTLSKQPILNRNLKNKFEVSHLTSVSIWDMFNHWKESMEFQYSDIETQSGQRFRIFNTHLEVAAGPQIRLTQLQECINLFDPNNHNLICGDFNIYGHPAINWFLGPIMGFKPSEYLINERNEFEKMLEKQNLKNNHRNLITYPFYRLQLDHILTPKSLVTKNQVVKDLYGSDHNPIITEISL